MPDLSIIIPIYNTPPAALQRCFGSILGLQGICYEVLLIDDGSGEETARFCQQYAQNHGDFLYFPKENGGVSSARNMGLDHARGKYITFVDGDDCLTPESFSLAHLQAHWDLVIFDMDVLQAQTRSTWPGFDREGGCIDRQVLLQRYMTSHQLNGPCAKLYKRDLLEKHAVRFDSSFVTAEDWFFGCAFAQVAQKVLYVPKAAYLYYREGGTSLNRLRRFPDILPENLIAMYEKKLQLIAAEFPQAAEAATLRSAAAVSVIENLFNCAADLYLLKLQTPQRKARIREVCRQAQRHLLPGKAQKTRIKLWLLTHFWAGIYPAAHLRAAYLKRKT